jgi:formate dehydrogenase major subunit
MRAAVDGGIKVPKLCATDSAGAFGSLPASSADRGAKGFPGVLHHACRSGHEGAHPESAAAGAARKGVMELYISDHPLDCLTCSSNGDCELQDMAGVVGLREVRYGMDGANHFKGEARAEVDTSNPYFNYDPSKCIVCNRCVRACEETQGTFALTISDAVSSLASRQARATASWPATA